jgi:type VI protein secretion system component Hcp
LASPIVSSLPAVQTAGTVWQLKGEVKVGPGGIPLTSLKNIPPGIGTLVLIHKVDAVSAHLKNAMDSRLTLPEVSITTPSGKTVQLTRAQITSIKTDTPDDWTAALSVDFIDSWSGGESGSGSSTHETERVEFTFQKIELESSGGKGWNDSWNAAS